ncbi:PrsW family intramembrane metalloprotease [Demequina pelophila]|uniref:PrsW family intramembrane metalloprotease n=1 Tax=Demequina pelophila TaxID=1638984 RepID=UPI000783DBA9|nr:PrsW family intramembrane metalloprotease [Demequina pelophila]
MSAAGADLPAGSGSPEPPPASGAIPLVGLRPRPRTATFVDPRSWVFWVIVALAVAAFLETMPLVIESLLANPASGALAAVLWTLYGVIFASVVYGMELFERRSLVNIAGAVAWGALVAVGVSRVGGAAMRTLVQGWLGEDSPWLSAVSAPLVEEPLKALGVVALALIPGARIRTVADGAFYGGMIGLGFQVVEGFLYTARTAALSGEAMQTVGSMFILRGLVAGLWSHAAFTAVAGMGVAYFFVSVASLWRRWGVLIGMLAASMVLHGFLNSPLVAGSPWVAALIKGVPITTGLVVALRVSWRREREVFARMAKVTVPDHLVSPADFEVLGSRRARREALVEMRERHGVQAARDLRAMQRAQLQLLVAAHTDGLVSSRAAEAAGRVTAARSALAWSVVGR